MSAQRRAESVGDVFESVGMFGAYDGRHVEARAQIDMKAPQVAVGR